jgi:hypothetical protein
MVKIFTIILFILLTIIVSFFLIWCFSFLIGIEHITSSLNPEITDYLNTPSEQIFENRVYSVDYLDKDLAEAVINSGAILGTHQSYSYKTTDDTLLGSFDFAYSIPFISPLINGFVQTQSLNIKQQLELGTRLMDIRVSYHDNKYVVDHGVILGYFDEFIDEFDKAVDDLGLSETDIKVVYKISRYSEPGANASSIKTYIENNSKYSSKFITDYDRGIYLDSNSVLSVMDMLKYPKSNRLQLILTQQTEMIIVFVFVNIIAAIIIAMLIIITTRKVIKYFK